MCTAARHRARSYAQRVLTRPACVCMHARCPLPLNACRAVGIICCMCLVGRHPFDLRAEGVTAEMVERIRTADVRLDVDNAWASLSPSARDFAMRCLQRDPHARPTAAQACIHPWLQTCTPGAV
ncbi:hypothetical protein EON66_03615 [archaeon]|nr:MAG: hypothetical protein EON66_03615 [archaeon]